MENVSGRRGEAPPGLTYRRVLLVGFMGSGKSTVGSLLASRLGWRFRDFDLEIERRLGASVAEIFQRHGEQLFRELEQEVGSELLAGDDVVLASGGGWPAAPGRMEALAGDTLSVWLKVRAETAVARVRQGGGVRPLLEVADPLERARRLVRERDASYRRARLHLDSDSASPSQLVEYILSQLDADGPDSRHS